MINENAIISAAAVGADQQHHASSSSSAACLPPAPNDGELKQRHVPPAAASCSAPVCGHSMFGNPCAVGVVVGLLGLGVLLVAALSPPTAPPTAPIGPTTATVGTVRYAAGGGGGTPFRQPSPFAAPAGAAGGELSPATAGRFVGIDQQQQQIDALRARLDQLQYELLGQVQYATSAAAAGAEPWPPAFFTVDYNNHPKSLLARRHMAWQPMRRGIIENDEQQHGSVSPRHISWQPMKRQQQQTEYGIGMYGRAERDGGGAQKEQVMRTVEQQLVEVLKAGDRLGVSADEILAHLRAQNENGGAAAGIGRR